MKDYFSKLANGDDAIGQDDRNAILRLLRKPWNPYVFRHSVTTEYLGRGALTKHQGDQFFGWSQKGNTAVHYQNYFGDEASDSLGAYFGVAQKQPPKVPKQRQCPNINCQELNTPEAPFCRKCRIPLSIAGHLEREQEFKSMKEETQILSKQLADVIEQQQQHANTFDMKFHKLLEIVKSGPVGQDETTRSFISGEIAKMMPRKLTTKELQKIEEYRNLTGVFIDSTPD
jgi:hypothetical protein